MNSNLSNSVLVVWDMQNRMVSHAFNRDQVIRNISSLIHAAHEVGVPVVYTQQTELPEQFMSSYRKFDLEKRGIGSNDKERMQEGNESWKIINELAPTNKDLVIKKSVSSLFIGTIFDLILRNRKIDTYIMTGLSSHRGVEATARHGAYLGYFPIIAEDAVGGPDQELHEAALKVMRSMFDVRSTRTIVADLEQLRTAKL